MIMFSLLNLAACDQMNLIRMAYEGTEDITGVRIIATGPLYPIGDTYQLALMEE